MQPKDLVRTCPHCSAHPTPFQRQWDWTATGPSGETRKWILASCPACGGPINLEVPPPPNEDEHPVLRVVPEAVGEWEVGHLPPEIERDWSEAVSVFRVSAAASAVVMCGRTLEAAANRLDIEGRRV